MALAKFAQLFMQVVQGTHLIFNFGVYVSGKYLRVEIKYQLDHFKYKTDI
jgi:hypothetical protein